eukprot:Hpha_TRINITY_DN16060_c0_g3::TRINITY_DN16060_c0_g3_i2::g.119442::m.119442
MPFIHSLTFGLTAGGSPLCISLLHQTGLLLLTGGARRRGRAEALQLHHLLEARGGVHVLKSVEQRALLALSVLLRLGVNAPLLDELGGQALLHSQAAEGVRLDLRAQPVQALSKALERARAGVHGVVAGVRHRLQSELLPVLEHLTAERRRRRLGRVGRAQQLAPELGPRHVLGVPVHDVVVDGLTRHGELGAHRHEETVEGEEGLLTLHLDQGAVEPATKLHALVRLLRRRPQLVQTVAVDVQLLAGLDGVVDVALGQSILPGQSELTLELVPGHVQLLRRQDRRLAGDRVVVLVDQLLLVDHLRLHATLLLDLDTGVEQALLHQLPHRRGVGVRLDEHERAVARRRGLRLQLALEVRRVLPDAGALLRPVELHEVALAVRLRLERVSRVATELRRLAHAQLRERVGLRLHLADTGDLLHRVQEGRLRRERLLLPLLEELSPHRDDQLVVLLAPAHNALQRLQPGHLRDVRVQRVHHLLDLGEGELLLVVRPLHAPLTRHNVVGHIVRDLRRHRQLLDERKSKY